MRKMNDVNFATLLRDGRLALPPLEIRVRTGRRVKNAGSLIDVTWRGHTCRFVAELRRDAKPLTLKNALDKLRQNAPASPQGRPMIIAPYLSPEKLNQLLDAGISAIDFSGNAAIEVPGKFLFYKTGNPNQFPDSSPIRSAYRGDGSLVARVLLLEPRFPAVGRIVEAIRSRGGTLTMGMVSKVLRKLEADLAIERPTRNAVHVLQPERLLDGLLEARQPPKTLDTWTGKVALSAKELLPRLQTIGGRGELVRTGESSAVEYAAWAGEPLIACYCRATPEKLLSQLDADAKETRAFANLRLIQTDDQRVYFDARPNLAASPIQAWLEMAGGDKRQKEVAAQIRNVILGAGAAP
jgi:hypothetical protein